MTAYDRVIDALNAHGCRGRGRDWQCPAHEDRSPSLSITRSEKGAVLHCHAGCATEDVVAALQLAMPDLFDQPLDRAVKPTVVAQYPYVDEHGELLMTVKRLEPGYDGQRKTFRQYAPDGKASVRGVRRILYRLPEVLAAAQAGGPVFVVEGEKDADNLAATGATATCNVGGAGKWSDDYVHAFKGASEVIVIRDRDEPGAKHAAAVAASLQRAGIPVRVLEPAKGKDVSDHLAAGLGYADLIDTTAAPADPPEEPTEEPEAADRFPSLDWHAAFATDFSRIDWLPGRFMERGQQVALVGDGKVGKTLFAHDWLWRAVTGRSFLGDERRPPLRVTYFDRENGLRDIITRMLALGARPEELDGCFDYRMFPKFSGGLDAAQIAAAELLRIVQETKPDVVVLDTVSRFISGKENDSDTWLQLYGRVHAPLKDWGVACTRLDHMGKDSERGSRGSSAKSQDVDHVWEMTRLTETSTTEDAVETVVTQIKFKRTHTRTGLGSDLMNITRRGRKSASGMWLPGQTRHELTDGGAVRQQDMVIQSYVDHLLTAGVPGGLGRDALKRWADQRQISLPGGSSPMAEVVKRVKAARQESELS
ncbi:AAA family ATPase [Streptomyces sp. NPDC001502]|uniref:AAA family ATPase n=1 Tax=Streptomyces sp. NPDC001502 TaxID=3364578 RepID=UPI00369065DA